MSPAAAVDDAPELDPATYGFHEAELDQPIKLEGVCVCLQYLESPAVRWSSSLFSAGATATGLSTMHGFLNPGNSYTVRQLLDRLKTVYCGSIGYEYMHITNRAQCNWIRDRIETASDAPLSKEEKLQLLDRLCFAEVCSWVA
jgi:2-oxoglutarate dehydrogenase complex dehydrogenase (E1) component-like enzyme